jgi:hypothetical protein
VPAWPHSVLRYSQNCSVMAATSHQGTIQVQRTVIARSLLR